MNDSLTTSKSSSNPRFTNQDSREADENDQMFLKTQNPKKQSIKHFMAPTISASSKAALPRNKILTERNEASDSSQIHYQKPFNPAPKASPARPNNSSYRYNSDNDERGSYVSDSSSKPYDPLTNYTSPRPKFLRYNPNKHREMLIRRETEIETDSPSSSVSSSLGSFNETESEEIDIVLKDDDEHDLELEFENDGCLSLKGIFKFLLVSVALFLLTWHISSMNSSAPSPIMHLREGVSDGYVNLYNRTYDIADGLNGNGKLKEINESFRQLKGNEIIENEEKPEFFLDDQTLSVSDLVSSYDVSENSDYHEMEAELEEEGVDRAKGIAVSETEDKSESFQDDLTPSVNDLVDSYVSENSNCHEMETELEEGVGHEKEIAISESEDKSVNDLVDSYDTENGNSVSNDGKVETESVIETIEAISAEEKTMEDVDITQESSMDFFSRIIEPLEDNKNYGAFIGSLMIVALSILAFFYRKCKKAPSTKSQPNVEKAQDSIIEDSLLPTMGKAQLEKVDSFRKTSTYLPSTEEGSNDFPLTHAPMVELLGEFVVGDYRSSMKSCNTKSKTEKMEFEEETKAVFVDKAIDRTVHLSTPEFLASTNMVSPSYRSSTPAKKIVKNEEGSVNTATPVRRSSRIRSRAISPQ